MNGNDVQEAEENALASWYATASCPETKQQPDRSASIERGIETLLEDDSKNTGTWLSATSTASNMMKEMGSLVSKTMTRLMRSDDPTASVKPSVTGGTSSPASVKKRKRDSSPEERKVSIPEITQRLDYALPVNLLENMQHEYFSGLTAHFAYWPNKDMANFLLQCLFPGDSRGLPG